MSWNANLTAVRVRRADNRADVAIGGAVLVAGRRPARVGTGAWRYVLRVDAARTGPRMYRALTGRQHPQVSAMHRAYRRRRGRRGWKR